MHIHIRIIFNDQLKMVDNMELIDCLLIGTPGVGKSRICAALAKKLKYKWQDVSNIAKENNFVDEYDETLECPVLDEDKVGLAAKTKYS